MAFVPRVTGRSDVCFWVRGTAPTPLTGGSDRVKFSGWVMLAPGVNMRNSPRLLERSNHNLAYRQTLSFDGWTYGETVKDLQLGTPDAFWEKLARTNFWVPSAYIYGNAPNSRPTNDRMGRHAVEGFFGMGYGTQGLPVNPTKHRRGSRF